MYVDDLIITASSHDAIMTFKLYHSDCFSMKDLGCLKYFLGLEIAHGEKGLYVTQRKYILDIVNEADLYWVQSQQEL